MPPEGFRRTAGIGSQLSASVASGTESRAPRLAVVGSFPADAPLERYPSGDLAERLSARGWQVLATSTAKGRLLRFAEMLSTVISARRRYDIALVDVFSGRAFLWAEAVSITLEALRKPVVLVVHGGNLPEFARRRPRRVERLLGRAAAVASPSPFLAERLRPFRDDIRCVPNAIDVSGFEPRTAGRHGFELIWLRAFHEVYDPAQAPEVLARLAGEFPNLRLTMIGPDKGDGSLARTRERARALGVHDACRFVGRVEKRDVPAWLAKGDIFLNTARIDNAPVSVLEAQAAGLCVVSTNVGGIPWLLESGRDGLLVPPGDAQAMAVAVGRILREPALANTLSQNARRRAEDFDWPNVLLEWESLIRSAVAARSTMR